MYALYFLPNAPFELNVSHKIRTAVMHGIRSGTSKSYLAAFEHVSDLLNDAYVRFRQSSKWKVMREALGYSTILHDSVTVDEALYHIQSRLPKDISVADVHTRQILAIRARLDVLLEERLTRFSRHESFEEAV
ncbi:hypothetical protein BASA61_007603 [Batrachochytrium salamandrivorans]|nr:hypothetical protein BASA61_007603 [Batrachochytrium salamandrivorans]